MVRRTALRKMALGAAFALSGSLAPVIHAQTITATLRGTVADEQAARLPGATVTALNVETNQARSVTTGRLGQYFLPNLPAGSYELTAKMNQFAAARRTGLVLRVGQEVDIDFTLKVGLQESVEVVEQATILQTTQNTIGTIINKEQIDDLPTVERDFSALARLSPGVTTGAGGNGETLSVNGQRWLCERRLRGRRQRASGSTTAAGSSSFAQDWIQEFQVMTNSYRRGVRHRLRAASSTSSPAAAPTASRGRAYGFFRDDSLDAAPFAGFFENGQPQFLEEAPPLSQQRLGGLPERARSSRTGCSSSPASRSWTGTPTPCSASPTTGAARAQNPLVADRDGRPPLHPQDRRQPERQQPRDRALRPLGQAGQERQAAPSCAEEARVDFEGHAWNVVANWTTTLSNTSFNEVRAFYGSNKLPITSATSRAPGGRCTSTLGPPGTFARRQYPGAIFGCPIFTGLEGEENLAFTDNFSFVRGAHQIKLGAQAVVDQDHPRRHQFPRRPLDPCHRPRVRPQRSRELARELHRQRGRHPGRSQRLELLPLLAGHLAGQRTP